MTWARDDKQYVAVNDGLGWFDEPGGDWLYNSRLWALEGTPHAAKFSDVPGYPPLTSSPYGKDQAPRYYNFGTLALDGRIYQFLSTYNRSLTPPDGGQWVDVRFVGAKLIYSPDNGRTWCNQNGSTPIEWESWNRRSRETIFFFNEPQEAFSILSVLQMGRNYEFNRDGYIYIYAPNGNTEGTMNELVMCRVPKGKILDRSAYEYFAGLRANNGATWSRDIAARAVVCTFPRGWVGTSVSPWSWSPSVVYNAPLGLYMMANWGSGCTPDGMWFGKPSYLGMWIAANPWGPWTQIHEETAWLPGGDAGARAYMPQIAPKWIAADGRSFWLVWTDFQNKGDYDVNKERQALANKPNPTRQDQWRMISLMRQSRPYYAFNVQRVDLMGA